MKKVLVLTTLFFLHTYQVYAGDTLYWSGTLAPGTGCTIVLTGLEAPVAVLQCRNNITSNHEKITSGQLEKDGVRVDLMVSHGDTVSDPDDIFYVTPQEGYYAVPPSLRLKENEKGTIEIYKAEGFLLG